ncbi:hypothetical protein JHK85_036013 [Glycine max]|nr:hypothetical protein JHK85_036013 [Glycine max]
MESAFRTVEGVGGGGIFVPTIEAERISVDHFAYLKPSDGGSAATQSDLQQRPLSPEMAIFYITQDTQRHPLLPELKSGSQRALALESVLSKH